jgi:hypothetical protein
MDITTCARRLGRAFLRSQLGLCVGIALSIGRRALTVALSGMLSLAPHGGIALGSRMVSNTNRAE